MDIDLLSKMVLELILENDRVALPGLGEFACQMVPSSITDKGYTINPPYRKLVFRPTKSDDGLLSALYSKANGVTPDVAEGVVVEFISGMKTILKEQKSIFFPGLGRLRATRENNVFFVAEEGLDIFPDCFGLEPVSLKSRRLEKIDFSEASLEPVADAATDSLEINSAAEEVKPRSRTGIKVLKGLGIAAGVAAFALGAFMIIARVAPDFVDGLLYTPEELEIINYGK